MVERTLSNRIQSLDEDFKILLLTGARQVGKTTMFNSIRKEDRKLVSLDNNLNLS